MGLSASTKAESSKKASGQPLAVVTGAGGGIGRQIALCLADHGYFVVSTDIIERDAEKTAGQIRQRAGAALGFCVDVATEQSVLDLFAFVEQGTEHHSHYLLVNNAGVQTWSSLLDLDFADWKRTMAVNLDGCFLMTRSFARFCRSRNAQLASTNSSGLNLSSSNPSSLATATPSSSIVNIGSGCNKLAFPNLVDYNASKGGVEMLTKSAALELGAHGIRVNCIAPGAIATDRTAAETPHYDSTWAQLTPLARVGQTQDIARAVLMLAGEQAAFISGQTINVDGGLFSQAVWPRDY